MGMPTFMYRKGKDGVEAKVFDSDDLPKGWVDDPAKVDAPKKRGRPRKDDK